jgi:hypothetical protein
MNHRPGCVYARWFGYNATMTELDRLNLEILGLMLQVAWADEEVASQEAVAIIGRARELAVGEDHIELLEACLRGEKTLPPPDMGFLRLHRDDALAAIRTLIAADEGGGNAGEAEVLAQIEEMLGPS